MRQSNQSQLILVNSSDMFETLMFSLFGFLSHEQILHSKGLGCSLTLGLFTEKKQGVTLGQVVGNKNKGPELFLVVASHSYEMAL